MKTSKKKSKQQDPYACKECGAALMVHRPYEGRLYFKIKANGRVSGKNDGDVGGGEFDSLVSGQPVADIMCLGHDCGAEGKDTGYVVRVCGDNDFLKIVPIKNAAERVISNLRRASK